MTKVDLILMKKVYPMSDGASAFESSSLYLAMKGQSNYYQLLFPYLQLESGPLVTPVEKQNAFFTNPKSLDENTLMQTWIKAQLAGNRADMQVAAVAYINGDQFLRYPQQLLHPMSAFSGVEPDRFQSVEDVTYFIETHFIDLDAFTQWLASSEYQACLSRIWLSVFSLLIILDYEVNWLDQLISLLALLNFLDKSVNQILQKQPEALFTYRLWSKASLRLPDNIFPLPKAISNHDRVSCVRPYSIGTLHRIEYKLVGYELGELQKIESLLQGELRERHHDFTVRKETEETITQDNHQHNVNASSQNEHDLLAQVQQTLSDRQVTNTLDNYATQYIATSANASTSGSWTIDEKPVGDEFQKKVDFVKDVLSNTEQRVVKQVNNVKQMALSYEQVTKENHRFNNDSKHPINGFYYWLNKRYRVQAIESQKRLMIEINLNFDGCDLHRLLSDRIELKQRVPKSLKENGVAHYSDIQAVPNLLGEVNDKGSILPLKERAYYLNLYQIYEVDDIVPPPKATRSLSRSLRSESRVNTQAFDIPTDYCAKTLKISALIEGNVNALTLLVAGECFHARRSATSDKETACQNTSQDVDSKSASLCLKNSLIYSAQNDNSVGEFILNLPDGIEESLCLSLSMELSVPTVTGNTAPVDNKKHRFQQNTAQIYTFNLGLSLTPESLSQWQLGVYERCNQAFMLEWQAYQGSIKHLKERLAEQDNKVTLSLINRELVKMSMNTLFDHAMCFVANDKGEPRERLPYQQYFDHCLDWQHLYCQLMTLPCEADKSNNLSASITQTSEKGLLDTSKDDALIAAKSSVKHFLKKNDVIESCPILAELDSTLYLYRFLTANKGKVLVPVKPGFEKPFVYFYDTGRIWHGKSSLTPVNPASLSLMNDYQQLNGRANQADRMIDRWHVSLPTTMSVIASNDDLYRIGEHLDNED